MAKAVRPGWYGDREASDPRALRYWDGESWTDARHVPKWKPEQLRWSDRPDGLIIGSVLLAFGLGAIGSLFYFLSFEAGTIALFVIGYFTSALFMIGIIAKGVELGIRAARHRPDLDF